MLNTMCGTTRQALGLEMDAISSAVIGGTLLTLSLIHISLFSSCAKWCNFIHRGESPIEKMEVIS